MSLTLVLGGARSGKSSFAEKYVQENTEKVLYIATAIPFDDGMKDRIKKHQLSRPQHWYTEERYQHFADLMTASVYENSEAVLLDCMTVMVTNLMMDFNVDYESISMDEVNQIEEKIQKEVDELLSLIKKSNKNFVIVSNEVGLGLVPPYKMGNFFRDISGRVNQKIASSADHVYFIVSGLPWKLK